MLKGVSSGTADLLIWKTDGSSEKLSIQVIKLNKDELQQPLLKAISRLSESEILFTGKGVILRGEISSAREAALIDGIKETFPDLVHDETIISESTLQQGYKNLQAWLLSSQYTRSLRVERVGNQLWLRGSASSQKEKDALTRKAKALFSATQTEISTLPDSAPTVYFRVYLLELKRTHFQSFGMSWPDIIPDAFQVTTGAIQNMLQFNLALKNLEGTGHGRVLSKPELVVRAPGEAELFAGGELPIQVQNRYYSDVTWKNYGLTLKLKVTHVTGEKIRLDIFTEVSHLDSSISHDRIPGFQSNRMKTQVDAQFGVPLFLSGLLQQGMREEVKGLPLLQYIPILGSLFGSSDYLNEQSELVAVLYPHSSPPPVKLDQRFRTLPTGRIPPPRNWISPSQERALKNSKEYPWNVLD